MRRKRRCDGGAGRAQIEHAKTAEIWHFGPRCLGSRARVRWQDRGVRRAAGAGNMSDVSYGRLRQLVADEVPVAMATIVEGEGLGTRMIVSFSDVQGTLGDPELDDIVVRDARATLDAEVSVTRKYGEQRVFLDVYPLPPDLILFGAVHLAQALSRFAQALGFRVTVVDARRALATEE